MSATATSNREENPPRKWVWYSSAESTARGDLSVLAATEVTVFSLATLALAANFPITLPVLAMAAAFALPGLAHHTSANVGATIHGILVAFMGDRAPTRAARLPQQQGPSASSAAGAFSNWQFITAILVTLVFLVPTQYLLLVLLRLVLTALIPQPSLDLISNNFIGLPVIGCYFGLALFLAARTASAVFSFLAQPIATVRRIPVIWFTRMFCADLFLPPELIPGLPAGEFAPLPKQKREDGVVHLDDFSALFQWPAYIGFWVGAYISKVVFKATFLLLWPISHVSAVIELSAKDAYQALALSYRWRWSRVFVALAVLSMLLFLAKVALYCNFNDLLSWWKSQTWLRPFDLHVAPYEIPLWQVIAFLNSLLLLAIDWPMNRVYLGVKELGETYDSHQTSARCLVFLMRVRLLITIYVSLCLISLCLPWLAHWPPIRWRVWPP